MINGVEIQVGQVWITRSGREAYVVEKDDHAHYPCNISWFKGGSFDYSTTLKGLVYNGEENDDDLISLKGAMVLSTGKYRDINGIPLVVGDLVRVVAKTKNLLSIRTPEYSNCWVSEMDSFVNDGVIRKITSICGQGVYFGHGNGFPSWVLEKVEVDKFQETLEDSYGGDALAMARAYFKE